MKEREREEKKKEEIELEKFLYFGKLLDLVNCVSFWFTFHFLGFLLRLRVDLS